ncbi:MULTISPECIES: hypothetical protein [Arthrobacter]|uniref:Uncharacterized protein n=1 Tax=Arthrobacter terricola TaxID=2547396 RepID=A0A4R5KFC9_9MICC|nr:MULTISPECIES: hypothetical protein [Arthrobacter]MBT8162561.1 hypothetical protein [Arthrobacter sp. GN70]TDF92880.1 hypothetical protein E1809_17125 [Arthrobacter terricola]
MVHNKTMRFTLALAGVVIASSVAACGAAPSLAGNWKADDGTGMKVISSNGACSGMYYNGSTPLDIGGGMSCSLSDKKGSDGRYSLVVSQPPNQASYEVEFNGNDTATVYSSSGSRLYSMARQ